MMDRPAPLEELKALRTEVRELREAIEALTSTIRAHHEDD